MGKRLLIIFYRNPQLGKVKKRLATTIGEGAALAIYLKLSTHTRDICLKVNVDRWVCYSDYVDTEDAWPNAVFRKHPQKGNDLGERMQLAFQNGFEKGYDRICIIGTDCFEITAEIINSAFDRLDKEEVVIGPAVDGGYYLLGSRTLHKEFFEGKSWGSRSVLNQTLKDINHKKLSFRLLPILNDVDVEDDLPDGFLDKLS
jgi:hypothetical protein